MIGATITPGAERAFPIYRMLRLNKLAEPLAQPKPKERGRIILPLDEDPSPEPGALETAIGDRDAFLSALHKEDIVWVPLYRCSISRRATWPAMRLDDYDWNLSLLRDIAPRVKAVLVGNQGPELCLWVNGPGLVLHHQMLCEFARHNAELIRDAGGRPAFGTVDWDLAMDCYGSGVVGRTMQELGALQLCFCGYTLVPECECDRTQRLYMEQLPWLDTQEGGRPYHKLIRYLTGLEVWSGVNFVAGLRAGNDYHLASYGFKAGFVGV